MESPLHASDGAHRTPRDVPDAYDGPGASAALDAVYPAVYEELRRLAHRQRRRETADSTLTTTALVHEAYLRLLDQTHTNWQSRAHFMAIAATAMHRILVDRARRHRSEKRGGNLRRVTLDEADLSAEDSAELLVAVDEALQRLASLDARQARVVECRFFGGMNEAETAEALSIGLRTVKRDWSKARSWLYREIFADAAV